MQRIDDRLIFSPSDLNHFLECEHLIQLERHRDPHAPRAPRDAHAELLAEKGAEHERAWLDRFRGDGKAIVTIASDGRDRDWAADAERTVAAMRDGADVIYQAAFANDEWHGVSDFLVRVERPSALGDWSYEAWDTKLARHTKPYFVLQLCFYTEQLERLQGVTPEGMVVVLGTGEHDRLLYRDFDAYYRSVRVRFVEAAGADRATYPYPVGHCAMCEHAAHCARRWDEDDHLSGVAHIRREQVQRLNGAGIRTIEDLSGIDVTTRIGIGSVALERLRHQAALQTEQRRTGAHRYELLPVDERTGFRLLPASSRGDVFFDMEGDPYFSPERGLEYLFGFTTIDDGQPRFRAFQGLDRAQEKAAFEQFIDFVCARLEQWPDLHVYHYAAYEPSALKRLMAEHATREDELDDLLRREVFVDLYQVVRQSMRISHPSYSIKKVRTFFMEGAGQGVVTEGGDSILEFERWRRTGDPAILQAITDYNEEDCLSTLKLRDWLIERKAEAERTSGVAIAWKTTKPYEETEKRAEEDALTARRRERLQALGTSEALLLADLLNYHRREAKPEWWAYFDRQKKSLDDLLDDTEAIAYLTPVEGVAPEKVKLSLVYTLEFPDQEFKLSPGDQVEDPFRQERAGTIEWLDSATRRLGLKRGMKRAEEPLPAAITVGKPLDNSAQREAIGRVSDRNYSAIVDMLRVAPPRVVGRAHGSSLQTLDLAAQRSLVASLDNSYLFIQGPPGSGKTWTGARLIVSLIAAGKRVGVAANSHKAINNLLAEVESVARHEHVVFKGLKKCSDEDDRLNGTLIEDTEENEDCEAGDAALVAGTSWLFSREGMDSSLDYLFIDEAGQVSLADAIAMGTAARNIVLLGDPQQLPQVRQGIHPGDSGGSVLEHLLAGRATVPEDRGVFLSHTWRMHPDVCAFISQLSYDGRLMSAEGRDRQRITSTTLDGTGLRFLPVDHAGNSQGSVEEANAVAAAVRGLLAFGTFTDIEGQVRPLRMLAAKGEPRSKNTINRQLRQRGFTVTTNEGNAGKLRQWLEGSAVVRSDWSIDETVFEQLTGASDTLRQEWLDLGRAQRAVLTTLREANAGPTAIWHSGAAMRQLCIERFGPEVLPEDALRAKVLNPLEAAGWIQTTGRQGRGGKIGDWRPTAKLLGLPGTFDAARVPGLSRGVLRHLAVPLLELKVQLKSGSVNERGLALETFAVHLALFAGLEPLDVRLRNVKTGRAEVDVLAEGQHLLFSRWIFQCKNTPGQSLRLPDLAREIGMAALLNAQVVVMVTTGRIGAGLRKMADSYEATTSLQVVLLEGRQVEGILTGGATIFQEQLREQAKAALTLKRAQVAEGFGASDED